MHSSLSQSSMLISLTALLLLSTQHCLHVHSFQIMINTNAFSPTSTHTTYTRRTTFLNTYFIKAEEEQKEKQKSVTASGSSLDTKKNITKETSKEAIKETATVRLFQKADSLLSKNTSKPDEKVKTDTNKTNNHANGDSSNKENGVANTFSNIISNIADVDVDADADLVDNKKSSSKRSISKTPNTLLDRAKSPMEKLQRNSAAVNEGNSEIITNDVTGFTTTINKSVVKPFPDSRTDDKGLEEKVDTYKTVEVNGNYGKFSFGQRIESIKAGIVGAVVGGISLAPFAALHDIMMPDDSIANGVAQWEFDTDTGALDGALFGIVYRYCVRDGEQKNEMLQMGAVGAFVIVRTFARMRVPVYCTEMPLDCGAPFGYFDWDMIQQATASGLESIVLFGAAATAVEYCADKKLIKRFK